MGFEEKYKEDPEHYKKKLREIEITYNNKKYEYKELKHIKKEILETKFKMDEDEKDQ